MPRPGPQTAGPRRVLNRWAPTGLSCSGLRPGLYTADFNRAVIRWVPARPSDGGPQPDFHATGSNRAKRRGPVGSSFGEHRCPSRSKWRAPAGPSIGGPCRAYTRRVTVGIEEDIPTFLFTKFDMYIIEHVSTIPPAQLSVYLSKVRPNRKQFASEALTYSVSTS